MREGSLLSVVYTVRVLYSVQCLINFNFKVNNYN